MDKPFYQLQSKCAKLRWDNVRGYWWCCSTQMCYRQYDQCPLIEGMAREVKLGNVMINKVIPLRVRRGIKKLLKEKTKPRQLSFLFTDNS